MNILIRHFHILFTGSMPRKDASLLLFYLQLSLKTTKRYIFLLG